MADTLAQSRRNMPVVAQEFAFKNLAVGALICALKLQEKLAGLPRPPRRIRNLHQTVGELCKTLMALISSEDYLILSLPLQQCGGACAHIYRLIPLEMTYKETSDFKSRYGNLDEARQTMITYETTFRLVLDYADA